MSLYAGTDKVCMALLNPDALMIKKTITENGEYKAIDDNATGYSSVTVNVESVNNQDKTITENGEYTADEGYSGLGTVTVNVETVNNQDIFVSENGTYTADEGYSGLGIVDVNVDSVNNQDKTIDENGTYTADEGYSGLGTVNVNVLGIGDTITAKNYTFKDIQKGERVYIKKNTQAEQESISLRNSGSSTWYDASLIDRIGTFIYTPVGQYNIETGSLNTNLLLNDQLYSFSPRYDSNGNIFLRDYKLYSNGYENLNGLICIENDYAYKYDTNNKCYLYKLNKNDFSIVKTWTFDVDTSSYYSRFVVIGNILCKCGTQNNPQYGEALYYGIIDDNSDTITLQHFTNSNGLSNKLCFIGSTKDNKHLLVKTMNGNTYTYSSLCYGIQLYKIDDNYNLIAEESENSDFNIYKNLSEFYVNFNRDTGILTASKGSFFNPYSYNVFRYENDDFETISLVLNTQPSSGNVLSITDDFTKAVMADRYYKLTTDVYGTYELIPYSYGMGKDIFTGIASENILQNDSGRVYVGTVITPDLQSKIIRRNGLYTPLPGYHGFSDVDVGVGQVGETYEAENLTGNNINQYDKVWLNYRQLHITDSYTDNSVDGHSSVGNSIGFICDKTTSNLYYNAYSGDYPRGRKYDLINNEISNIEPIGTSAYQGCYFTYLENNIPAIIRKTGTRPGDYSSTVVSENGIENRYKHQIGYGCYLTGPESSNQSYGYFYFPDGTKGLTASDISQGKVWKNQGIYYLCVDSNYTGKIYKLDMENKTTTFLSSTGPRGQYLKSTSLTSDNKHLISFVTGQPSNYQTKIYNISYLNDSCSMSDVTQTILPSSILSIMSGYHFSWFNPINNTLIVAPLTIHNINEILVCRYNPNTELFEDITSEVNLPNSSITLKSYNSGISGASLNMWMSSDYKILILADTSYVSSTTPSALYVYYMDNAEGWVITNYNNINPDSITGFASEVIAPNTTGNVIVGIPIGSDSGAYSSKLTLQGVVDGLPQPNEDEIIEDTIEILNEI